jgi:hypothetical protein
MLMYVSQWKVMKCWVRERLVSPLVEGLIIKMLVWLLIHLSGDVEILVSEVIGSTSY